MALAAGVIGLSRLEINARNSWKYPAPNELLVTEHFAEDLGMLMLGAHRMAADVAYIQFLQYYGKPEQEEHEDVHRPGEAVWEHDMSAGLYPLMKTFGIRTLRLDPFFTAG